MSVSCYPSGPGTYQIVSVAFSTQDADLLYRSSTNDANGIVGGYAQNQNSNRMVWQVADYNALSNGNGATFSLYNQEIPTYASISGLGTAVSGDPNTAFAWSAQPVTIGGQNGCIIYAPMGDTNAFWTLADGNNRTPIIGQIFPADASATQLWTFVPVNPN